MALAFAAAGADVVIASRKLDSCEATAEEIRSTTAVGRCRMRVTSGTGTKLEPLADAAYAEFGKVDILVNNAACRRSYDRVDSVTEPLYDKVLDVNLRARSG